jgi:hypothetical protein
MSDNVFNINDKVLNLKAQFQICRMAKNSVCQYCKIQSVNKREGTGRFSRLYRTLRSVH